MYKTNNFFSVNMLNTLVNTKYLHTSVTNKLYKNLWSSQFKSQPRKFYLLYLLLIFVTWLLKKCVFFLSFTVGMLKIRMPHQKTSDDQQTLFISEPKLKHVQFVLKNSLANVLTKIRLGQSREFLIRRSLVLQVTHFCCLFVIGTTCWK